MSVRLFVYLSVCMSLCPYVKEFVCIFVLPFGSLVDIRDVIVFDDLIEMRSVISRSVFAESVFAGAVFGSAVFRFCEIRSRHDRRQSVIRGIRATAISINNNKYVMIKRVN